MAERVQEQNWQQHCLGPDLIEPRQEIESGGYPEYQRAEEQIDRENVHGVPWGLHAGRSPSKSYSVFPVNSKMAATIRQR